MQILWLSLLTLAAAMVGTATGFGTSTIMVPVLSLFVPMPVVLLFVGIPSIRRRLEDGAI